MSDAGHPDLASLLWPPPRELRPGPGFPAPGSVALRADDGLPPGARTMELREDLRSLRGTASADNGPDAGSEAWPIEVRLDPSLGAAEAYALSLGPKGARLRGSDGPGLFYGGQTLLQCLHRLRGRPSWPALEIVDRPAFPLRAFMVDAGRSVFSRAYLERIVRIAARLKLNALHLHLYDDELCGLRFDGLPFGTENPGAITMADLSAVVT